MFFTGSYTHFFKPLQGKYREIVVSCLGALYERQYTSMANYGQSLARRQVLSLMYDTMGRDKQGAKLLDEDRRKLVVTLFNQLRECGWLEERVDRVSMSSTYTLTIRGREFSEPFVNKRRHGLRTRHRNTRNTRNALKSFAVAGDINDLLDACEYSEKIIADFSDIITELEQRRVQLIDELQHGSADGAADQFFEFLETRFKPDLAVRLSADSVERYRDDILDVIAEIRAFPKAKRLDIERQLRALKMDGFRADEVWYESLLRAVEQRLYNACDVMLPAVRDALTHFTRRAEAIIRHVHQFEYKQADQRLQSIKAIGQLDPSQRSKVLKNLSENMSPVACHLIDPASIKLKQRRKSTLKQDAVAESEVAISEADRLLHSLQMKMDSAFSLSDHEQRLHLAKQLMRGEVEMSNHQVELEDHLDLLTISQLVGLGSSTGHDLSHHFKIEATGETIEDEPYFHRRDGFNITLLKES